VDTGNSVEEILERQIFVRFGYHSYYNTPGMRRKTKHLFHEVLTVPVLKIKRGYNVF